jgi:hypothetical protein
VLKSWLSLTCSWNSSPYLRYSNVHCLHHDSATPGPYSVPAQPNPRPKLHFYVLPLLPPPPTPSGPLLRVLLRKRSAHFSALPCALRARSRAPPRNSTNCDLLVLPCSHTYSVYVLPSRERRNLTPTGRIRVVLTFGGFLKGTANLKQCYGFPYVGSVGYFRCSTENLVQK